MRANPGCHPSRWLVDLSRRVGKGDRAGRGSAGPTRGIGPSCRPARSTYLAGGADAVSWRPVPPSPAPCQRSWLGLIFVLSAMPEAVMPELSAAGAGTEAQKPASEAGLRLIGATGFEPATARPPAECATRLRHAPWFPRILTNPRGGSSMAEPQPSKLMTRVRLPSAALGSAPATARSIIRSPSARRRSRALLGSAVA
jgi:hypothetical protein